MNKWMSEWWMNKWGSEWMNEWMNERMNEWRYLLTVLQSADNNVENFTLEQRTTVELS